MALTPKQRAFINEYLIDLNATQAAIRAGYSEKTAYAIGQENLKKLEIKEEIDKALQERSERVKLNADWVLKRLQLISDRCIQGEPVYDREGNPTGEWRFDSAGANKATELIGKHLGMFKDKIEHTGNMQFGIQLPSDIDEE